METIVTSVSWCTMNVIPAVPSCNCSGMFKPAVDFCISLLKAHSGGSNCQEQHMGRVQLLRGREWDGASANGFCVPAHVCVCRQIQDCIVRTCTTEIGRWFVNQPKFTLSRSYKYIRQQSEICAGWSRIMLDWVAGFEENMLNTRYPALKFKPCLQWGQKCTTLRVF